MCVERTVNTSEEIFTVGQRCRDAEDIPNTGSVPKTTAVSDVPKAAVVYGKGPCCQTLGNYRQDNEPRYGTHCPY